MSPGSNIDMNVIASPITTNDNTMMAKALLTDTSAISLLKISIRDFPLAKLKILSNAMAKVLVLMPPPVD